MDKIYINISAKNKMFISIDNAVKVNAVSAATSKDVTVFIEELNLDDVKVYNEISIVKFLELLYVSWSEFIITETSL